MRVSGYISKKVRVGKSLLIFFIIFFLFSLISVPRNTTEHMCCLHEVYKKGSFWAIYLQYRMHVLMYRHFIEWISIKTSVKTAIQLHI